MRLAVAVAVLVGSTGIAANDPAAARRAADISRTERKLPWFWSPSAEGLPDILYTYEEASTRRFLTAGGKEIPPAGADGLSKWRSLKLERIPLEWGSFLRCLAQDGATPCSKEWDQELERQVKRVEAMSPEEKAQGDQRREERRQRRREFWDEFPAALDFQLVGADQLVFAPRPGYKTDGANSLLRAMKGRLWFDAATNEVVRMEYELVRDVDDVWWKVPKGTRFEIELSRSADQHYVPARIGSRGRRGKGNTIEESTREFAKFRRFGAESKLTFGDK